MVVFNDVYYRELQTILGSADTETSLFQTIVNAPFENKLAAVHLGLGVVVLLLYNPATHTVDRIALSDTEAARGAVRMTSKPFHAIKIPFEQEENIVVRAIKEKTYQQTTDWQYLFTPELSAQEARFNQAGAGIEVSVVYPLDGPRAGALIFSYYDHPESLSKTHSDFMQRYTLLAGQRLTAQQDIGQRATG